MNTTMQYLGEICILLAVTELAGRLCSENTMVRFVRSLAVLVLLISFIASLFSLEPELPAPALQAASGEELTRYVQDEMSQAQKAEVERYLQGLLASAGLEPEKIEAKIDIGEDSGIVLTGVGLVFSYDSEGERARVLLENTLGEAVTVEVQTHGR